MKWKSSLEKLSNRLKIDDTLDVLRLLTIYHTIALMPTLTYVMTYWTFKIKKEMITRVLVEHACILLHGDLAPWRKVLLTSNWCISHPFFKRKRNKTTNCGKLNNKRKSFVIVNTLFLCEAFSYKTSFVTFNGSIGMKFSLVYPTTSHRVLSFGWSN